MSRNICSTEKLEKNFAVFLKVTNCDVTLKLTSLHTGQGAKWERNC